MALRLCNLLQGTAELQILFLRTLLPQCKREVIELVSSPHKQANLWMYRAWQPTQNLLLTETLHFQVLALKNHRLLYLLNPTTQII